VLVHRPGEEMRVISEANLDPHLGALVHDEEQWYWRDTHGPDLAKMQRQHDTMTGVLKDHGVEVIYVDGPPYDPKAVFTRDTAVAVDGGVVICRMGLVGSVRGGRRGEERYVSQRIASLGCPILHTIHGDGLLEGGSCIWLTPRHMAVGMGHRQNEAGVRQLEGVLRELGVELIRVDLTGYSLHLDGAVTMVHHDVAVVNVTRLSYWFLDFLKKLGIRPVYCHPDEWGAVNSLAIAPGKVLMSQPCERTAERLAKYGIEVIPLEYDEILKNGGGIRCSTCPLIRDAE
jgi:N-dimethylarginine dimethylaminohydrolase